MANRTVDLGIFTAYGEAREAGYEGSKAEFEEGLKKAAEAYDEAEAAVAVAAQSATEAAASAVDASIAAAKADSSADAAQESETAADVSASAAASSAVDASESASDAATAKTAAETAQTAAEAAATAADGSKTAAAGSASAAASSATAATSSATAAAGSASDAAASATAAVGSATDAAASATDAAESATKAEQAASTIGYTKWADLERLAGVITSSTSKWSSVSNPNHKHVIIAVEPGDTFTATGTASYNSFYGWLTSDSPAVQGEDAPLCAGTTVKSLAAGRPVTDTAPEDAKWLYMVALNGGNDVTPATLVVDGVNLLTNVAGNVGWLDARVSRLEALVDYIAMMADIDISGV